MRTSITDFRPEHLPAVQRLWERMYERPRSGEFYRWSLLEAPDHVALVALAGDECVAMIRAFTREIRADGSPAVWGETFDWVSVPEHRRAALGLAVMRKAMERWAPLLVIGGSDDTQRILPALGWGQVNPATAFVLPLRPDALSTSVGPPSMASRARRAGIRVAAATWLRPRRGAVPAGGEAVPVAVAGEEILDLYDGPTEYRALPVPSLEWLRWLTTGFAGAGLFTTVYFTVGGRLRGWGLSRVHRARDTWDATLLEVYAPRPTVPLYAWMVSELVARALGHSPAAVRAQVTCPVLAAALHRLRFVPREHAPVFVWPAGAAPAAPRHFTSSANDGAMLPYPTSWDLRPAHEPLAAEDVGGGGLVAEC